MRERFFKSSQFGDSSTDSAVGLFWDFQHTATGPTGLRMALERSCCTMQLYLSTRESPDDGGATTFWSWNEKERLDVGPKLGRVLIFQQDNLVHTGEEVDRGLK